MHVGDSSVASAELTQGSLESFSRPNAHDSLEGAPPPSSGFVTDNSIAPPLSPETESPVPSEPSSLPSRTGLGRWLAPSLIGIGTLVSISLIWAWWQQNQELAALPSSTTPTQDNVEVRDPVRIDVTPEPHDSQDALPPKMEESNGTSGPAISNPGPEEVSTDDPSPLREDVAGAAMPGQPVPNDLLPGNPLLDTDAVPLNAKDDPLAGMPRQKNETAQPDKNGVGMLELPAGLAKFTQLLNLPGPEGPADATVETPAMEEMLDEAAEAVIDPLLMATPPVEVDFQRAMNVRVALKSEGYPLPEFLNEISQIIQVPIDLQWVHMELAGISVTEKVIDPTPGWKTSGELLQQLAQSRGAELTQEPTHITFGVTDERLTSHLGQYTDISDLPEAWHDEAATAVNRIASAFENPLESQIAKALTTDALRRLLEESPKISDDAFTRLAIRCDASSLMQQEGQDLPAMWPKLINGESGPQTYAPMTLPAFISRTARANQASCFIHWPDLIERRIPVGQRVMGDASLNAGEMLSDILTPLVLQTRQIAPRLWWVGTEATYDRTRSLVFGEAGVNITPERFHALALKGAGAKQGVAWWLDEEQRYFVLLVPRYLYRQLPTLLGQTPAT